jgi:hypothetical protein
MDNDKILIANIAKRLLRISELLDETEEPEKAENIADLADKVVSDGVDMSEEEFAQMLKDLGLEVN